MTKPKPGKGIQAKPYIFAFGFLVIALSVYLTFGLSTSHDRLIPFSILTLIAGLVYEFKRKSVKWSTVFYTVLISFILSLLVLVPEHNEEVYNLANHIVPWPYAFIFFFMIIALVFHGDKFDTKLTEGITLIQSAAIIYWVIDYGLLSDPSLFMLIFMIAGLILSLFTLLHAFSYLELSNNSRFILSLWSSIIMILFAVDITINVYNNADIENAVSIAQGLFTGLQFFLLGISGMYTVRNLVLLAGFIPTRGRFFNDRYFQQLKKLRDYHIKRFSNQQVSITDSIFCLVFSSALFALNSLFNVMPRQQAIWLLFVMFPFVLYLFNNFRNRSSHGSAAGETK